MKNSESRKKMMEDAGWVCIAPGVYTAQNPPRRPSEDIDEVTLLLEKSLADFKKRKEAQRNESNQAG